MNISNSNVQITDQENSRPIFLKNYMTLTLYSIVAYLWNNTNHLVVVIIYVAF